MRAGPESGWSKPRFQSALRERYQECRKSLGTFGCQQQVGIYAYCADQEGRMTSFEFPKDSPPKSIVRELLACGWLRFPSIGIAGI